MSQKAASEANGAGRLVRLFRGSNLLLVRGERSSRIHQQLYTRRGVQSVADVFATHSAWEPPNREILSSSSSSSIVSAAPQVLLLVRWVLMAMLTSKDDHRTFPPYNAVGAQWCGQRVGFSLMTLWPVSLYALYLYTYLPTARPTSSLYRITFENLFSVEEEEERVTPHFRGFSFQKHIGTTLK